MKEIVNDIQIKNYKDGTSRIDYSCSFMGNNHSLFGNFIASGEEVSLAFQQATADDSWAGFKLLVLKNIKDGIAEPLEKLEGAE